MDSCGNMDIKIIKEVEVMRMTGLSRSEMKAWRGKLEEGKCWVRVPSNKPKRLWAIGWTDEGVEALSEGASLEGLKDDLEKGLEKPKEVFGIVRAKYLNRRMILCDIQYDKVNELIS